MKTRLAFSLLATAGLALAPAKAGDTVAMRMDFNRFAYTADGTSSTAIVDASAYGLTGTAYVIYRFDTTDTSEYIFRGHLYCNISALTIPDNVDCVIVDIGGATTNYDEGLDTILTMDENWTDDVNTENCLIYTSYTDDATAAAARFTIETIKSSVVSSLVASTATITLTQTNTSVTVKNGSSYGLSGTVCVVNISGYEGDTLTANYVLDVSDIVVEETADYVIFTLNGAEFANSSTVTIANSNLENYEYSISNLSEYGAVYASLSTLSSSLILGNVPEPATASLSLLALAALAARRRRR